MELEGFIAGLGTRLFGSNRQHHLEVVELYKSQIVLLEFELSTARNERDEFKRLLHEQLGLSQNRLVNDSEQQVIHRPMSPQRMRQSLEIASRNAVKKDAV